MPFPLGHKTFFYFDYTLTSEDKAVCMRIEDALGASFYYWKDPRISDWKPISKEQFHAIMRPEYGPVDL